MGPLVLAIPVFNAGRFLGATLDSLNAEGTALRWWLQDGGSNDNTLEIANAAKREGDVINSASDKGQADAINTALRAMGGEIIGFINGDDVLAHGTASRVLDYFDAHPEIDLVYGSVDWIDESGAITGHHTGRIESLEDILDIYKVWWNNRQWVQPEVFFRRSLFEKVGGFDIAYHLAFDFDFWVRCFLAGARVAHIPQVFAKFRIHAAQKSTAAAKAASEIRSIVSKHLNSPAPVPQMVRWSLNAQLEYDRYQCGETVDATGHRPSFLSALLKNPQWVLSPAVRNRTQSSLAKIFGFAKPSGHK
jgi:glycosyltransferase involved in cell wall biosynthesis